MKSRTSQHQRRLRRRWLGVPLSLLLGLLLLPGARAAIATECSFDEPAGVVAVAVGDGAVATISRAGDAVTVDGIACGAATVSNTDLIEVALPGISQAETVVVDLSGGPLAPGVTDEGDGSSEIELQIDGTDSGSDLLQVVGSSGPDAIVTQGLSLNLNADEGVDDDDVTVSTPGISMELQGGGGDDLLSLDGFEASLSLVKSVDGGPGDDRVHGELGSTQIDGGPGRDIADYSWATFGLRLVWEVDGALIFIGGEDELAHVEVAILTDDHDTVAYVGAATGETLTGADADNVIVVDPTPGGVPEDRIVRGGQATFDTIEFSTSPDQPVTLNLTGNTIGGSWTGTHLGVEYIFTDEGDDRFRVKRRGTYPRLVGRGGEDVLDLRAATEGISVTMGQPTSGPRKWLTAYEVERVLGSDFDDVILGTVVGADPKAFMGLRGRDVLRGGAGRDLLVGGEGPDTLRGNGGADELRGWLGADRLQGGSGPDILSGGLGNDVLNGGLGNDDCHGGPGDDVQVSC